MGLTNGASSTLYGPSIVTGSAPSNDYEGEYVRPLYSDFIIGLKMECGYSSSGVIGSVEWSGMWSWASGGELTSHTTPTLVSMPN